MLGDKLSVWNLAVSYVGALFVIVEKFENFIDGFGSDFEVWIFYMPEGAQIGILKNQFTEISEKFTFPLNAYLQNYIDLEHQIF